MIQQPGKLRAFLNKIGREIVKSYGENHESTILHGGVVLNEFSPDFSDIDLVIVLKELSQADAHLLLSLWQKWRHEHPFGQKSWIHLISRRHFHSPSAVAWTVSKKGIQPSYGWPIDYMELHTLKNHGKTLQGENIISHFPNLPQNYQMIELERFLKLLEFYSSTSPLQPDLHQELPIDDEISIILSFPRYLYNLKTDKILPKCSAAQWYAKNYKLFRVELRKIADYRIHPSQISPDEIFAIYDKVPYMLSYFWNAYFKHLGVPVTVPQPVMLPGQIIYYEVFSRIRDGLSQAG